MMHIRGGNKSSSYSQATIVLQTLKERGVELDKLHPMSSLEVKNFVIRTLRSLKDSQGKNEFKQISLEILGQLPYLMFKSSKNKNYFL